jgi:protein-tyrosine phosphatase
MRDWSPNLDWITPDLSIGGSFPLDQAERLAHEHGVAAVIDLRAEACDDAAILAQYGIAFLHLPTEDHCAVSSVCLDDGVAFVRAQRQRRRRVLIHCQHGIGRSAMLALCILVDAGMTPMAALELAKRRRGRVSPSPAQHEGWTAWLQRRGHLAPAFGEFQAVAYRHLLAG